MLKTPHDYQHQVPCLLWAGEPGAPTFCTLDFHQHLGNIGTISYKLFSYQSKKAVKESKLNVLKMHQKQFSFFSASGSNSTDI
jgi:glutamine amidotransferase-like uncharacterized protein